MVGRLRGFVVNLAPASSWDERSVRVTFADGGVEAVLRDTSLAGATFEDAAIVGRVAATDWREVDAFLRASGVALEATVGGVPSSLALSGEGLAVREGTGARGAVRAVVRFCSPPRSLLVEAECPPGGDKVAGLDWVRVERWLARRGVSVRPRAVEPGTRQAKPRAPRRKAPVGGDGP